MVNNRPIPIHITDPTCLLNFAAGAIGAMVSKDIVHRDLKPQNILLHHDGRTKNPRPQVGFLKPE